MKRIKLLLVAVFLVLATVLSFSTMRTKVNIFKAQVPSGYTLDPTYDLISVSDLSIGGLTNQEIIKNNTDTEAYFTETDEYGSLIFKFKYNVIDTNTSDSNAMRVHFDVADDKWNSDCSVWFRGDGTHFSYYNGTKYTWRKNSALAYGLHEIEIGRIALLQNGAFSNKYYFYYKLNGVEIDSTVSEFDLSKMDGFMFINFSSGNTSNKIYDMRYTPGPYEIPDRISISDLKYDGVSIGDTIYLNEHHRYTYTSTAEHKSVVLSFLYDVKTPSSVSCQLHFSNSWLGDKHGGIIWFKNNEHLISKAGGGYASGSPFSSAGVYYVEVSKLYITSGTDEGKYYMSISVNGTKTVEYIQSEMPDEAKLFTTGTNGDYMYDVKYMPIEVNTGLYLYKWDASMSGIEFSANLRKDITDLQNITEVGFIIAPQDNITNETKVVGKLIENGNMYKVKAALASLSSENITRKYSAKVYYITTNSYGAIRTHYTNTVSTSFYDKLDDLSSLNENDRAILNEIKSSVLNVTIDEDDCVTTGATKSGDFSSNTIVLTGSKSSYSSFVLNGDLLSNNGSVYLGYREYKVTLGSNTITLTKQDRKMMYGGSEHFVEINSGHDEKMTAANLSPMTTYLGLKTIRLDIDFNDLFSVSSNNELTIKYSHVSKIQGVIDELKTNGGVTDFLAVFWVVQPYGFKTWEGKPWTGKTAPNPATQSDLYLQWLRMNGEAARIAATLFPDIHNFETWNEAEIMSEEDGPLARPDGTNYSVTEKAKILTDLMYYYNKGIKAANPKNVLTTPSLCCAQKADNEFDVTSPQFLTALYEAIVDSTPVTGYTEVDTDPNNYFQVINTHPYIGRNTTIYNWKSFMTSFHTIADSYGDGGTEIWITEFGFPTNRTTGATTQMQTILQYADQVEYITKFYFYKVHDYTDKIDVDRWGLYDYDGNIKSIGTVVKNYING